MKDQMMKEKTTVQTDETMRSEHAEEREEILQEEELDQVSGGGHFIGFPDVKKERVYE